MFSAFLDQFFLYDSQTALVVFGRYDWSMVVLSVLIAVVTSTMAMQLAGMAQDAEGRLNRQVAIFSGALVLGAGVWSMHFIGMLAFDLCSGARYDELVTLLSMLPSFLASWVALSLLAREAVTRWQLVIGGVLVGAGIGVMHYSGMEAAHSSLTLRFDPAIFALSIVVAVVLSIAALWLRFGLSAGGRVSRRSSILLSGLMLGCAISGMHYTGMGAARFITTGESGLDPQSNFYLVLVIVLIVIVTTIITGGANVLLRYRDMHQRMRQTLLEREEIAEALHDSEQQYRSLISNLPGVAFRCRLDENWSMLFISDAVERLSGWPPRAFLEGEKAFAELIHIDDTERVNELVRLALWEGESYYVEYRITRRDGDERWVSETGTGVRDESGAIAWIDGVIIDNTEAKLRNAEFESIVNAIGRALAMVEFDLGGHILNANENFLALTGYRLDELRGHHHEVLCDPEEVRSDAYRRLWENLRQGRFTSGEFRRLGKQGQTIWIQGSYNPIFAPDGTPYKVIKFATDLSERHAMEQNLREAKTAAEQATAAKSSFLANMSHEIRTPMNAIIGFTDVLLGDALEDKQRRHLKTVRNSARSLLSLLNDILDTAKLERGAFELEIADFSLRELCMQVLASLRINAQKKNLALDLDYPEEVPEFFKGDSLRLQQVMLNLLGNAIKFTERGSVELKVGIEQGEVHLVVSDTGIGIAEDRLERIFDPFAQADASMTRRFGGTGLGTTIARQLVELMNGRIAVESTLGVGSRFHVHVPLPAGEAVSAYAEVMHIELPPLTILVADDVPQNLELLELAMGKAGHRIITAADGIEALERFREQRFDLVLMDVQMPRLDGLEATRRMRALELVEMRERTPIIALTASVLEEDQIDALQAGMDGFATKPLELDKLNLEIARVLEIEVQSVPIPTHAEMPAVRGSVIDWAQGRRRWGSEERHKKAIAAFLTEHADSAARLRAAEGREAQEVQAADLHRLRGAAGNLALSRVSGIVMRMEEVLRNGAADLPSSMLDSLADELANVVDVLGHVAADAPTSPVDALNRQQLSAALDQLDDGLAHGELVDSAFRVLCEVLPAARTRKVCDAVDAFDFDAAREALADLRASLAQENVA
jgi:PAS domain S-box-containing protein